MLHAFVAVLLCMVLAIHAQLLYEGSACQLNDRSWGVCRLSSRCEWATRKLSTRELSPYDLVQCSLSRLEPIICCAENEIISKTTNNLDTTSGEHWSTPTTFLRPCEKACAAYTLLSDPLLGSTKVLQGEEPLSFHILGGTATNLGEFPHMVALGYPSDELNVDYQFNCGGSLISEQWILTAAHCVTRNPTIVCLGKLQLQTNTAADDGSGLTLDIAQIVSHPNYRGNRNYDDIALVRLARPVEFNRAIRPACINTDMDDLDASLNLTVTGWGDVGDGTRSVQLLKATLKTVDRSACDTSLTGYSAQLRRRFDSGLNDGHICARDPAGQQDSCQGDSGGPLQIVGANDMSTVVGVVSFGSTCGLTLPSVYTRVANYLDWIEATVWPPSTQ